MKLNSIRGCFEAEGSFVVFAQPILLDVRNKSSDPVNIRHGIFNMAHVVHIVLGVNTSSLRQVYQQPLGSFLGSPWRIFKVLSAFFKPMLPFPVP